MDTVLENKYQIEHPIGKGKFGEIFQGIHLKTRKLIAIKKEHRDSPVKILKHETTILNYLYGNGCRSIPQIFWFGLYNDSHYLVMTFYKCSLYDYRKKTPLSENHRHSILFKIIDVLEVIHKNFILHRDIKPQNFMITSENNIHLIDFGLANVEEPGLVLTNESKELIVGTPNYISYYIHCGYDPLRRDDLISVGYIALFLEMGSLPWELKEPLQADNKYPPIHILSDFLQRIKSHKKLDIILPHCSPNLVQYFTYCYELTAQKKPCYEGLKQLFLSS